MADRADVGEEKVWIGLSHAEAFVLYILVNRFEQTGRLVIEDETEEAALLPVARDLEKALWELFAENADELMQAARDEVLRSWGPQYWWRSGK